MPSRDDNNCGFGLDLGGFYASGAGMIVSVEADPFYCGAPPKCAPNSPVLEIMFCSR